MGTGWPCSSLPIVSEFGTFTFSGGSDGSLNKGSTTYAIGVLGELHTKGVVLPAPLGEVYNVCNWHIILDFLSGFLGILQSLLNLLIFGGKKLELKAHLTCK